ncbi:MAG TPA: ABC transporter ATP-binding protein [Chloroflexota bacterium]|nr:ABC transporter ATP-binding protein [Chloroflexota bacterium]
MAPPAQPSAPGPQPSLLELRDVHTYYGDSHILHGVSLTVGEGQAVALLGRNGAGKTTIIRTIVGFTPPRAGSVRFAGQDVARLPAHRIARLGIGLVPQGRRIFPDLSVLDNLRLGERPRPGGWTPPRVYEYFPRLRERLRQKGGTLSGGEQQMLAIGRALLTNPALLVMDEPSEGLAPMIVREIERIVAELKRERLSILLVEQNVPFALALADRVYVMNKGQIVFAGAPGALAADDAVKRQFLGV